VFDTWDDVRFDTERVIDNGDDIVALGLLHGRVDAPGMEIDSPHGQIWTFRDGRVVRMRWFNSHRKTLEAAGLWEQLGHRQHCKDATLIGSSFLRSRWSAFPSSSLLLAWSPSVWRPVKD
jgi:hypothetical protein